MKRAFLLLALAGAGCASGPEHRPEAAVSCATVPDLPVCQAERLHARAERLKRRLHEARLSYGGDDGRRACLETLTSRADRIAMVLSDHDRAERQPVVIPMATTYVDALEETFEQRCLP